MAGFCLLDMLQINMKEATEDNCLYDIEGLSLKNDVQGIVRINFC